MPKKKATPKKKETTPKKKASKKAAKKPIKARRASEGTTKKKTTEKKKARTKSNTSALSLPPSPLSTVPPPPATLRPKGVEIWQRVAPLLVERKALGELHLESFELLCREWQSYCELCEWCENHPGEMIIETEKGYSYEHPKVRLRQTAFANLKSLFPKFGLTPDAIKHANPAKPSDGDTDNDDALDEYAQSKPK